MIPKKTADLKPEKLRLILLMGARFNHNNKLIGKKMMEIGEDKGWLAPEQFGSRKAKSAIEHALNKRLCFDVIRQQRLEAVYIANDAKSCYDRILLIVAYITMRNFGIPALVARSSIDCIFNMKHHVRTKYGDSSIYYGGDKWEELPHGCGQGSSPLLQIMKQCNFGGRFCGCISGAYIHLTGIAFVDDTDLFEADSDVPSKDVVVAGQHSINKWNSLLRVTGGALEPSKTFWCKMGRVDNEDTAITISQGGCQVVIPRKSSEDSFYTLGVWQSPSGKEAKQVEYLRQLIVNWSIMAHSNYMSCYSARTAIVSTIGRTLAYPLAATGFTVPTCRLLQSSINSAVLGRMGIVRSVSKVLASGPTSFGGYGILDVEVEQMVQHVNMLSLHMHQPTLTSAMINISLENYILEAGKEGSPFTYPYCEYTTPRTWISNTISMMKKYDISIQESTWRLQKWGPDDRFIMDLAIFQNDSEARAFNKVRLFLRVATIADLLDTSGLSYDLDLVNGRRSERHPAPSMLYYQWPPVDEPSAQEKRTWKNILMITLNIGTDHRRACLTNGWQWTRESCLHARWLRSETNDTIYENLTQDLWRHWCSDVANGHVRGRN